MHPITENGRERGIGHSFRSFAENFTRICKQQMDGGRAQAFAFIFYDFSDRKMSDILQNRDTFTVLDRLIGQKLTLFYIASNDKRTVNQFNEIFLRAFEINGVYVSPFLVFFEIADGDVSNIEASELPNGNQNILFVSLCDKLRIYIENIKIIPHKSSTPRASGLLSPSILKSTAKKILLEKLIEAIVIQVPSALINS